MAFLGGSITWGRVRLPLPLLVPILSCVACLAAAAPAGMHCTVMLCSLLCSPPTSTACSLPASALPCRRPCSPMLYPALPALCALCQGGYEGGSFTNRFSAWLNATFPHPGHRIINHGLPAVTSALFAACYDKVPEVRGEGRLRCCRVALKGAALLLLPPPLLLPLMLPLLPLCRRCCPCAAAIAEAAGFGSAPVLLLLQDTDLIVLDFAVNDGHVTPTWRDKDGYSFTSGARMGFEQLASRGPLIGGRGLRGAAVPPPPPLLLQQLPAAAKLWPPLSACSDSLACCCCWGLLQLCHAPVFQELSDLPPCPCYCCSPADAQVSQAAGPAGAGAAAVLFLEQHSGQSPGEDMPLLQLAGLLASWASIYDGMHRSASWAIVGTPGLLLGTLPMAAAACLEAGRATCLRGSCLPCCVPRPITRCLARRTSPWAPPSSGAPLRTTWAQLPITTMHRCSACATPFTTCCGRGAPDFRQE